MEKTRNTLIAAAYIGYFAVGLVQTFAIAKGLGIVLGVPTFLAFIISLFIGWIPIVGTAAGTYGAHIAWGWPWMGAILFMVWPTILYLAAVGGTLIFVALGTLFTRRASN